MPEQGRQQSLATAPEFGMALYYGDDILLNSEEVEIPANHMWMDKHGDGVRTLYGGHLWVLYPEMYIRGTSAIYKAVRYVDVEGTQLQPLS